jgi:hypothetical protein
MKVQKVSSAFQKRKCAVFPRNIPRFSWPMTAGAALARKARWNYNFARRFIYHYQLIVFRSRICCFIRISNEMSQGNIIDARTAYANRLMAETAAWGGALPAVACDFKDLSYTIQLTHEKAR